MDGVAYRTPGMTRYLACIDKKELPASPSLDGMQCAHKVDFVVNDNALGDDQDDDFLGSDAVLDLTSKKRAIVDVVKCDSGCCFFSCSSKEKLSDFFDENRIIASSGQKDTDGMHYWAFRNARLDRRGSFLTSL